MPTKNAAKPTRNIELAKAIAADGRFVYEVAAASGINPTAFGKYIRGTQQPSAAVRARIAKALGAPEADLFGTNGDA